MHKVWILLFKVFFKRIDSVEAQQQLREMRSAEVSWEVELEGFELGLD